MQLLELGFQALSQPVLHQVAQVFHQGIVGLPDGAHAIAFAAHQAGTLQLAQLAADVGLGKAGDLDQEGHILRLLAQVAEQLQAGGLTQQPEEPAVFLKELRGGR